MSITLIPNPQVGPQALRRAFPRQPNAFLTQARSGFTASESSQSTAGVVTFEAVGGGNGGAPASPATLTWSHTSSGGPNTVVLAFANVQPGSSSQTFNGTATHTMNYGGTPMTSLGYQYISNVASQGWAEVFYLWNPPAGTETVTYSVSDPKAPANQNYISGNTVSYNNVASMG